MKRTIVLFAALACLAACGSDEKSSSTTDAIAPTTAASAVTTAPPPTAVATTAVATTASATVAPTTATSTTARPATTVAGSTTSAGAAASTAAAPAITDPEAKAAADAYGAVFDSTVAFDEKAAHLAEADSLQSTISAYAAAGSQMGGIALVPTAAVVADDTATVTYDVLFGGSAAYTGLEGHIAKVDGVWQVAKAEFCGFMAQARTPCPA
jgi:iron complex transport system substrate-binding protein